MINNNIGVILAGGIGSRFKSNIPKQYMPLNGKEVITYSIDAFHDSEMTDNFIIVVDQNEYENKEIENKYGVKCIKGGKTRNESLYNAIQYVKMEIKDCQYILFHDAARPFISSGIIDLYFRELVNYDAIITTADITDSLGKIGERFVDRSLYYLIQTPEAFNFKLLQSHFSVDSPFTAIIQQLPVSIRVKKYFNFRNNFKITYPEDLFIAEQLMRSQYHE